MRKTETITGTSFAEKVRTFSQDYLKCCIYISNVEKPEVVFTQKLYSTIVSTSMLLEDFLDFHGAKNNKNWYYYRELAASVRHLSLAANFQKHISNRLVFYDLVDIGDFPKEGEATLDFLTHTLMEMAPVILNEARRLKIRLPDNNLWLLIFPVLLPVKCSIMTLMTKIRTNRKKILSKSPVIS
jgi:hypothetical protein